MEVLEVIQFPKTCQNQVLQTMPRLQLILIKLFFQITPLSMVSFSPCNFEIITFSIDNSFSQNCGKTQMIIRTVSVFMMLLRFPRLKLQKVLKVSKLTTTLEPLMRSRKYLNRKIFKKRTRMSHYESPFSVYID